MRSDGLWVTCDVPPDGSYQVAVGAGPDMSIPLDPDQAYAYAMAALTAVMHAQHDAAVLEQFTKKLGLPQGRAGYAVAAMRERRKPVDDAATAPLRFVPGVSAFNGKGFVHVHLGGKAWGQLEPAALAEHALYVLRAVTATDVDTVYLRYLTEDLGVPEDRAREAVADVGNYYGEATP